MQAQIAETENAIQKLTALQSTLVQKEQDIKEAQDTISQLREQLDKKNQEIADLRAQLDALTDTADGFKITVDTANKMFGLTLPDGSTDKEIADAIQNYVRDKITSDETIEAIQKLCYDGMAYKGDKPAKVDEEKKSDESDTESTDNE